MSSASTADLRLLQLLQLADSVLPIGGMAHSFGFETLTAEGILSSEGFESFLESYLEEAGALEAVFCRAALRLASEPNNGLDRNLWLAINDRLSAVKLAQECRMASVTLGENFLLLVRRLVDYPLLGEAVDAARQTRTGIHHSPAFGLTAGALDWDEDGAVQAFLHHATAGLVSAGQRLLPLGQTAAARILWNLKAAIAETARKSRDIAFSDAACFTPLLDWGAFAHAGLSTRLFMS